TPAQEDERKKYSHGVKKWLPPLRVPPVIGDVVQVDPANVLQAGSVLQDQEADSEKNGRSYRQENHCLEQCFFISGNKDQVVTSHSENTLLGERTYRNRQEQVREPPGLYENESQQEGQVRERVRRLPRVIAKTDRRHGCPKRQT